mgnify:CR=1 FL=1
MATTTDVTLLVALALRFLTHTAVVVADALVDPDATIVNTPRAVAVQVASAWPLSSLTRSESDDPVAATEALADAFCTRVAVAVELTAVAETMVCRSALSNTL